jgi:hypothetical protein
MKEPRQAPKQRQFPIKYIIFFPVYYTFVPHHDLIKEHLRLNSAHVILHTQLCSPALTYCHHVDVIVDTGAEVLLEQRQRKQSRRQP